jgi:hypothetical protein
MSVLKRPIPIAIGRCRAGDPILHALARTVMTPPAWEASPTTAVMTFAPCLVPPNLLQLPATSLILCRSLGITEVGTLEPGTPAFATLAKSSLPPLAKSGARRGKVFVTECHVYPPCSVGFGCPPIQSANAVMVVKTRVRAPCRAYARRITAKNSGL